MSQKDSQINNNDKKSVGKIISAVIFVAIIISIVVLLISGMRALKENRMMKIFGYSFSVVVTNSMEDTIKVNDIIIVSDVPFSELEYKGGDIMDEDIIVYYNKEKNINVVHRIYGIDENGAFITKGDNNSEVDSIHITEDIYRGKVVKYGSFLGLGTLINEGRSVIFLIIILIFGALLISEIINFYKLNKEKQLQDIKKSNELSDKDYERIKQEELEKIKQEELEKLKQEDESKDE